MAEIVGLFGKPSATKVMRFFMRDPREGTRSNAIRDNQYTIFVIICLRCVNINNTTATSFAHYHY